MNQQKMLFRKRLTAVIALSAAVLLLIAGILVVNEIIKVYSLTDHYLDADGNEVSETYRVKKDQNGVYGLYAKDGTPMEQNSDGKYIARTSGNQYTIDEKTGDFSLYAEVAYDALGGESLGYGDRVMMFPQISQDDIYSIRVENEFGEYELYRGENGGVLIRGAENSAATYDPEKYASFCVACGYPLTRKKLDFSSPDIPRTPLGSVDYAAFGLSATASYTPARYTVTASTHAQNGKFEPDASRSYTVEVGNKTPDGSGYYVRLVGRDAIYIESTTLKEGVLSSVESMVMPRAVYQASVTTYPMVEDFYIARVHMTDDLQSTSVDPVVQFSYQDVDMRANTLYASRPYVSDSPFLRGYEIDNDSVTEVLGLFYEMECLSCVKLGIGTGEEAQETFRKYGLTGDITYLSYTPLSSETGTYDETLFHQLFISRKTERGTYYIASVLYDMIVEVDQYYLTFLDWEDSHWYHSYVVSEDLSFLKELEVEAGGQTYQFFFDNSLSYSYYIDENGTYQIPNLNKGSVQMLASGAFRFVSGETGKSYTLQLIDFDDSEQYFNADGTAKFSLDLSTALLQIYSPQGGGWISYQTQRTTTNDMGQLRTKTLTELDNFRYLYKSLLYFNIEGDVDRTAFSEATGMSVEEFIAAQTDDSGCYLKIHYDVRDDAASALMNDIGYQTADGKVVKLFTSDNEKEIVLRFYRYSGQKALMTLELITEYDEQGNPISSPDRATGRFYVLNSYLDQIEKNVKDFLSAKPVDDIG